MSATSAPSSARRTGPPRCSAPGSCGCCPRAWCDSGPVLAPAHQILVMRTHLPTRDPGAMDSAAARYAMRINGHLGAMVLAAFPALEPRQLGADTVLTGLLDRSALYGVLDQIDALG